MGGGDRGEQSFVLLLLEAQPVRGGHLVGALGLGFQPGLGRAPQTGLLAQAPRERDVGEADVVLGEQLAQRAQALQLGGTVEAVAGRGAGGLDEPHTLYVAQHARRPTGRLRRLVDRERIHLYRGL